MRSRRRLALFSTVLLALVLAACTGVPAPTYCYTATAATVHAVDTGMSVAGDLYRAGKLTDVQKTKLVAAHDVYRPAAQAAVAACKAVGSQGDADAVIANIKLAADKVIESLVKAGVLP